MCSLTRWLNAHSADPPDPFTSLFYIEVQVEQVAKDTAAGIAAIGNEGYGPEPRTEQHTTVAT